MTFAEVNTCAHIRRRSWPLGHFATRMCFGGSWYYERRLPHATEFYCMAIDVPGDDWEAYQPFKEP